MTPRACAVGQLDPARVRANLQAVRERIDAAARRAGRDPAAVEVCAATKYVPVEQMGALAQAGIDLVGENRAQDLEAKVAAHGRHFQWDFIGHLQSRKVKQVLPHVRLIHSVASDSALAELAGERGLRHLSMGTSQDYVVAVQEGATIVRLGSTLVR